MTSCSRLPKQIHTRVCVYDHVHDMVSTPKFGVPEVLDEKISNPGSKLSDKQGVRSERQICAKGRFWGNLVGEWKTF